MKNFVKRVQEQFDLMCKTGKLFTSLVPGSEVWEIYISAFDKDPVFRDPESSTHNCNLCKSFIKRYGNIVALDNNNKLMTIFDSPNIENPYKYVASEIRKYINLHPIAHKFIETYNELNDLNYESCKVDQETFKLGTVINRKRYTRDEAEQFMKDGEYIVKPNQTVTFNHLALNIPTQFISKDSKSKAAQLGEVRDKYNVFNRGMKEIPLDTLILVRDLINQNSLLDGTAHLFALNQSIDYKTKYDKWVSEGKDVEFILHKLTYNMDERTAKFRNTLMGTLCVELAEGMELNSACRNWNKRVDPTNYMKASAPITQKQINDARKFVEENGYAESFNRTLATLDNIMLEEVKHMNIGDGELKEISIFDNVKSSGSGRHKRNEFNKVEEVSIDKFMENILPSCASVEAFIENNMENNMAVITKSVDPNAKRITKWNNISTNYSWTFNGNIAGKSQIKENVEKAGGKITGLLRCSLQWNDEDTPAIVDFDLHCQEKIGNHNDLIYYSNLRSSLTTGWLDVDMIDPSKVGIENITYQNSLKDGIYLFRVKNFNGKTNRGFKVEIEFNGELYSYQKIGMNVQGMTDVATVTIKDGIMSIKHHLPETTSSKEFWGIETNQFHKVNLVCTSPNHWGDNNVGNLHYFFMLDDCKPDTQIRSFHNENLIPDLLDHRKVLEVLGNTNMIDPKKSEKALAGLGFNSTVKDELIVKVTGSHKRMLKIKF